LRQMLVVFDQQHGDRLGHVRHAGSVRSVNQNVWRPPS
jgi:hypothetical protein